jgi:hypothetical protein
LCTYAKQHHQHKFTCIQLLIELYSLLIRYDLFINFFLIEQKVHDTVHGKTLVLQLKVEFGHLLSFDLLFD